MITHVSLDSSDIRIRSPRSIQYDQSFWSREQRFEIIPTRISTLCLLNVNSLISKMGWNQPRGGSLRISNLHWSQKQSSWGTIICWQIVSSFSIFHRRADISRYSQMQDRRNPPGVSRSCQHKSYHDENIDPFTTSTTFSRFLRASPFLLSCQWVRTSVEPHFRSQFFTISHVLSRDAAKISATFSQC
jgi:hypothetical protein